MNDKQRELARHALGLPNRTRTTYRNHFVAGAGHPDYAEWLALVEAGYAIRRDGAALKFGGDDLFHLTKDGATLALDAREKLSAEDF